MELTIQYSPTAPELTSLSTQLGTPTQDERNDPATMQSLPPLPMVPPLIPTSTTGAVITRPPMGLLATVTSANTMMNIMPHEMATTSSVPVGTVSHTASYNQIPGMLSSGLKSAENAHALTSVQAPAGPLQVSIP